jgi:lipooligosaccharide transport system permease protein
MSFTKSVWTVWLRYFAVFQKNLWYGLITTFVEPILYLIAFGFGLGSMIGSIQAGGQDVSYRAFILAGLVGQTVLFTAFFDGAYGGFIRMYYQKIFQAISVTTVTLSEVLWGELIWCSTRALLSASVILLIGVVLGDFNLAGSLLLLPLAFVSAFVFAGLGMLVAAISRTIETISYPQYLLVFPMFLFCGVYFPLTNLPELVRGLAWVLPLTSFLSLARTLVLGFAFEWWSVLILSVWLVAMVILARRAMRGRIIA